MKRFGLILAILVLFMACDSSVMDQSKEDISLEASTLAGRGNMAYMKVSDSKTMMRESNDEQKIIRSANLRYEVNDMDSALKDIKDLLLDHQGEVENERQYSQPDRLSTSMTVRVPAEDFDSFIEKLLMGENIRRLEERSISARDVTEQFIDVEARLKTKKQTMTRYRELLQKAESVSEIINVEDKIRRLQEEIESREARLKYLSEQVDMSEVRIDIYQVSKSSFVPDKSNAFFPNLLRALHSGLKGIVVVFFWIVRLWPIWLTIIIIRLATKKRKQE